MQVVRVIHPRRLDDWLRRVSADHIASCWQPPKQGFEVFSPEPGFLRPSSPLLICLSNLPLAPVDVMPLESKYALRVSSIPDYTTKEQYADFVRSVSAGRDCKRQSIFSSFKAKHWRKISKRSLGTPAEPYRPASSSASGQDDGTPLVRGSDDGIRTSFASQHGLEVGTIAFSSKKTSDLVLERHEKARRDDAGYPWKDWDLSNNFQGITVLYEPDAEEENGGGIENDEGIGADKRAEGSQRSRRSNVDME